MARFNDSLEKRRGHRRWHTNRAPLAGGHGAHPVVRKNKILALIDYPGGDDELQTDVASLAELNAHFPSMRRRIDFSLSLRGIDLTKIGSDHHDPEMVTRPEVSSARYICLTTDARVHNVRIRTL